MFHIPLQLPDQNQVKRYWLRTEYCDISTNLSYQMFSWIIRHRMHVKCIRRVTTWSDRHFKFVCLRFNANIKDPGSQSRRVMVSGDIPVQQMLKDVHDASQPRKTTANFQWHYYRQVHSEGHFEPWTISKNIEIWNLER